MAGAMKKAEEKSIDVTSLRTGKWSQNPGELDEPPYDMERAFKANEEMEAEEPDEEEPEEEDDDEDDDDY
jgi:hypothetical protein